MHGIIYKLTNLVNGKAYVGQTTRSLDLRFKQHATCKTSLIGKAIRKYGTENFSREKIEECDTLEWLNEREKFWIAYFNCKVPNGYNQTDGGEGASGCTHSPEWCTKVSAKLKGRPRPPEVIACLIAANTGKPSPFKGKKRDPSIGKKISAAKMGKLSPMKGKHHSEATKAQIAASNTGKKMSPEAIRKTVIANTGRPQSAETRRKRSAKLSGRFNRRRPIIYPVLEELLTCRQINDRRLAEILGLSQPTVSKKLEGKVNFSPAQMSMIKKFLGTDLSVEEIFMRTP